jgi:hypothetical protein
MPSTHPLAIVATSEEEGCDGTDDDGPLSEVVIAIIWIGRKWAMEQDGLIG